eukprot:TRINITY_DN2671_c0_g2_i3.p1 TRINITY_DN2671_c0_g2~~TRINITY_DN2671_c0_g2_i3.p1  ORF type:complete len:151 (-),score=25.70 TRINITY_DN2671_c0_g2_i3:245-697(-)
MEKHVRISALLEGAVPKPLSLLPDIRKQRKNKALLSKKKCRVSPFKLEALDGRTQKRSKLKSQPAVPRHSPYSDSSLRERLPFRPQMAKRRSNKSYMLNGRKTNQSVLNPVSEIKKAVTEPLKSLQENSSIPTVNCVRSVGGCRSVSAGR